MSGAITLDVNGDGFTDLAEPTRSDVRVLLSDRAGFYRPVFVSTPPDSAHREQRELMAAGDLDHDGRGDLILTRRYANDSSLTSWTPLLGQADGTFRRAVALTEAGASAPAVLVAIGDLTGDGNADLLYRRSRGSSLHEVTYPAMIAAGDGRGGFAARVESDLHLKREEEVQIVDFTGDGRGEVVVSDRSSMVVFVNDGDHRFTRSVQISGYDAVADMNGDGNLDFLNSVSLDVQLMNGLRPGRVVHNLASFGADSKHRTIRTADFDRDGKVDVATSGGIAFGAGDGTFRSLVEYRATDASVLGVAERGAESNPALLLNLDGTVAAIAADEPIGSAITDVALTVTETPTAGREVRIEARVTSGTGLMPRGAVRFEAGGVVRLGTIDSSGRAYGWMSFSTVPKRLTATYLGDERFAPSSAEIVQAAIPATSRVVPVAERLAADGKYIAATVFNENETIYLRASVASRFAERHPTALITVSIGEKTVGLVQAETPDVPTRLPVVGARLGRGRHVLAFHWPGDADRLESSETVVVHVNGSSATFEMSTEPKLLLVDKPMTVTATFPPDAAEDSVTFFIDEAPLGTAPVVSGKASITVPARRLNNGAPRWGAGVLRADARRASSDAVVSRFAAVLIYLGDTRVRPELWLRSLQPEDNERRYRATIEISPVVDATRFVVDVQQPRYQTISTFALAPVTDGGLTFAADLEPNVRYTVTVEAYGPSGRQIKSDPLIVHPQPSPTF